MSELIEKLHRTWVEILIRRDFAECAALIVDARLEFDEGYDYNEVVINGLYVYLPIDNYQIVEMDSGIKTNLSNQFKLIARGHIWQDMSNFPIDYRIELLKVDENWQNTVKFLIKNSKDLNQGLITEKCFTKENKNTIIYNEMKFASKSEVRIAQELEKAKILFFPLPLAVKAETGNNYKDHREVDFLICHEGRWGILEVAFHPDRYEMDKEKDAWFKKSGVLCVEHYTAERCYNSPREVVNEFINILTKHQR